MRYQTQKRSPKDYLHLSRSVLLNHARTEAKKTLIQKSTNVSANLLTSKFFLWIAHYLKSRFGPRHKFVSYKDHSNKGIYQLGSNSSQDSIRIALVADWATDTPQSDAIGDAIKTREPHYSIHLGDTYYVGTHDEIENNYGKDSSWPYGTLGSFVITGNHEMYSNGVPLYRDLLPRMGLVAPNRVEQHASYFCLENEYWRIIGLDTGYRSVGLPILEFLLAKADLPQEILDWLREDVKIHEDKRGIIFLTHHQYNSAFERPYPKTSKQLASLIGNERDVLWFFGHEHRFAIYGNYKGKGGVSAYSRCIGHGGMPEEVRKKVKESCVEESKLVLHDPRKADELEGLELTHNGFCILELNGANLIIKHFDEQKLLVTEEWNYDTASEKIVGVDIQIHEPDLKLFADKEKAIKNYPS